MLGFAARRWLGALRALGAWAAVIIWPGRNAFFGAAARQVADTLAGVGKLRWRELLLDPAAGELDDHRFTHDIHRHHLAGAVGRLHPGAALGQLGFDLQVLLVLVGKAAQQPAADSADLGWVERQILILGYFDRDARIIRQERRAAQQ